MSKKAIQVTVEKCRFCQQSLMENRGCLPSKFVTRTSVEFGPARYGKERLIYRNSQYCPDCGAGLEGFHHPYCDVEECPVFRNSLRSCNFTAMRFFVQRKHDNMVDATC